MKYDIEIHETCSYRKRMTVEADSEEEAILMGEEEGCGEGDFVSVDSREVIVKRARE